MRVTPVFLLEIRRNFIDRKGNPGLALRLNASMRPEQNAPDNPTPYNPLQSMQKYG